MAKIIPKFGTHEMIQFVGVSELAPEEQALVSKLSTEHYEKIKRMIPNLEQMVVHVKCYENDAQAKKKKYSLHVRVKVPSASIIESCKSHDFDLARALHKSFDDIRAQIEHKFHTGTHPKGYE